MVGHAGPLLGCAPASYIRSSAADADLLTEPGENHVDSRRIGIREFGEIADTHHHLGIGVTLSGFQIPPQRTGEALR